MAKFEKIPNSQVEVRDYLVNQLEINMIGPHSEDEEINFDPKKEYYAGVIYPKNSEWDEEDKENEQGIETGESDTESTPVSNDKLYKQSAFGLSCIIKENTKKINLKITHAKYKKSGEEYKFKRESFKDNIILDLQSGKHEITLESNENIILEYTVHFLKNNSMILDVYFINNYKNKTNYPPLEQIVFQPKIIIESLNDEYSIIEDNREILESDDIEKIHLELLLRNKISFGTGHLCGIEWNKDEVVNRTINKIETTFIPKETIEKVSYDIFDKNEPFLNMRKIEDCESKEEMKNILMPIVENYKNWITKFEDLKKFDLEAKYEQVLKIKINEINDEVIPRIQKSIDLIAKDDKIFDAFKFANLSIAWQQTMREWSEKNIKQDEKIKFLKDQIRKNKKLTENDKKEKLLELKPEISEIKLEKDSEPLEINNKISWRLFQISFILLNIESIADENSKNREIVDLLWFPTGGGKTEAYLGLIAFTIGLRRLRGMNSDGRTSWNAVGVAVIMRYTLRLLTVQQFQRAARLMCACEKIRRNDLKKWGHYPFLVGLWVGGNVTPNRRTGNNGDSALEMKYQIRQTHGKITEITSNNPYILLNCPWCGHEISEQDGDVVGKPTQWRLFCGRSECMFSKKLDVNPDRCIPVVVTDDDVYSRCPSMLISTGDKFAQLPWKPETASIFGLVDRYCEYCGFYKNDISEIAHQHDDKEKKHISSINRLLPPELIIQDELHLISASFGSIFAIYESAIEYLSIYNEDKEKFFAKPKIIASTATTKAASKQIKEVFNRRKTRIFPPQVKDFGDTFFSKIEKSDDEKMYLGYLPTNKSGLSVQAKISATLMYHVIKLNELGVNPKFLDPYFTLVSYYNAQKDLGGSTFSFRDSVPNFTRVVEKYSKFDQFPEPPAELNQENQKSLKKLNGRFYQLETKELTSRQASGEIPQILRELEQEHYSVESPVDVLFATNMLSVGVDIPRLGLMLVNGQPKKHSEYIQASGRIGRNNPGLIITLYSYSKYRDLSQYENFKSYHSKFYNFVEDTSVTPFTMQTRNYALFGVMSSIFRLLIREITKNNNARLFSRKKIYQENEIIKFKNYLKERIENIDSTEIEDSMDNFDKRLNEWTRYTEETVLKYRENPYEKAPDINEIYLFKSDLTSKKQKIFVPTSFRNTEEELKLFYNQEEFDD